MRFGLVFLRCPLALDDDQQRKLVGLAAQAWFDDRDHIDFDWPGLRGEVKAKGEAQALGSFVGQRFEATVHQPDAAAVQVDFLVAEKWLRASAGPVAEA